MSELRISSKPTLGFLLANLQTNENLQSSQQKITFPKINTKLKKTHFTKYHSAFINAKSWSIHTNSELTETTSKQQSFTNQKASTEHTLKPKTKKLKSQHNMSPWKLNKKHHESYQTKSTQKLQWSRKNSQSHTDEYLQKKDNVINEPYSSVLQQIKNQKFSLLTEIRQLHLSPTKYSQTERPKKQNIRKSQQINQTIERSNKIIALIQQNYRKGFFESPIKNQSSLANLEEKLGLFSYLKRNFITKKQTLTPQKIIQYFKTPCNNKLQAKINFETRSFLKQKLLNDYRSYKEVDKLRENLSQQAIQKQIDEKKIIFQEEYKKKYNVPYMSYLSLPKPLKRKVLSNLTSNKTLRSNKK